MFGSLRSQRTSLVPLFKLLDKVAEVKQTVDDTLNMSKAVVASVSHPDVAPNPGWGEDDVPALFMPLLIHPEVSLEQEDKDLDLSEIDGLAPEVIAIIQGKARDRAALNREHAEKAIRATNGLFVNMYRSLADFGNYTRNAISTFMLLYAVSDFNQRRLVKQKMATIFRPDLRHNLTSYMADPSLGVFGGQENVLKTLEDTKKQKTLVKNSLLKEIEATSLQPGEPSPKARAKEPTRRKRL